MKDFLQQTLGLIHQKKWLRSTTLAIAAFALVMLIKSMGLLNTLEFTALNQAYTHRQEIEVNPDIAFWNLTDDDIEMLRWPWAWDHIAETIQTLKRYGVKLALFQEDIFSNSGHPTLSEDEKDQRIEALSDAMEDDTMLQSTIQNISSSSETKLTQALIDFPNIVLSQAFVIPDHQEPQSVQKKTEQQKKGFLKSKIESIQGIKQKGFPAPADMPYLLGAINLSPLNHSLQPHVDHLGFMRITPDPDGTIRQLPTVVQYDGSIFYSQPIVAAAKALGVPLSELKLQAGKLTFGKATHPKTKAPLEVPIDEQGKMYVNWTQKEQLDAFHQIPFAIVRNLATWDILKKEQHSQQSLDTENLTENLNRILTESQKQLTQLSWLKPEKAKQLVLNITAAWIIEQLIINEFELDDIYSVLESIKWHELDVELYYNSILMNNILAANHEPDEEPMSFEEILRFEGVNLHPHRVFLPNLEAYLNVAPGKIKGDELLELLSDNELITVDEDYLGDATRVIFQHLDLNEAEWLTKAVIKTNLSQQEVKDNLLYLYTWMKEREQRLKDGYHQTLFHLKRQQLKELRPLLFPEPANFKGRLVHLHEFKDKTVFVGLSATGLNALNPTPYVGRYPMAALTPTAFNTITTGEFIEEKPWIGTVLVVVFAFIVFVTVFYNALAGLAISLILAGGHYFLAGKLLQDAGIIMPIVSPILSILASYITANIYLYIEQQKERQKIRGMFSAMVSPEVLKIMEEEPDKFNLRGEKVEASMFSSDVSGFTSISEGVTAQELALILNLYLTPMSNLVMTFGGYVEKYEGDAIKADFGMPLPDNDHAWKACYSALLQQEELTVVQRMLQLKYGVMITARMGVNTGVVNAGNMGSINKMQYCALGEEVAMAEELEPSNKMWETWIAISPETLRLSEDRLETRLLDVVEYEYCTIPVYELIGWKEEAFLDYWDGKPIPKLVIEGWERIIPEKILAYIDYYRQHRFDDNDFYKLMLSTFEGLEQKSLDFMKLNDRIEVAGLEKRYLALLQHVDQFGLKLELDDLDAVDQKELNDLSSARDNAEETWLKLLNGYLVELKWRTHIAHRLLEHISQEDINELLTNIDTLEKNCNCYIKRNRFPESDDGYGNILKDHLVSILPKPDQGLSEEQLEQMKAQLNSMGQEIKQSMMQFISQTAPLAPAYHQMMAKHCLYSEQKKEVCEIFAKGRELYLERQWDEAKALFEKGLSIDPEDGPCMKFIERCETFKKNEPEADWDGTWEADW